MSSIVIRARSTLALIRKYGLRKTLIAYRESSSDRNHVLAACPKCGTEHRIHKLRAAYRQIRCTNCRAFFTVMKASAEEEAFVKAFRGERR